ncbi:MAG: hypothetical protein ABI681_13760 [Gemmatimonadales bacterium]
MSRAALLLIVPLVVGCSKKDAPPADTAAVVAAPEAPAPPNVAGTWSVKVMPADKDTTLLTYVLVATNDKTGWQLTLPNRPTMEPTILWMDNDSIVVHNGPYASVLRKNQQVTTHSNMHMEGDKLVGTTIAHYVTKGADSVVNLRNEGTRQ